MRIQLPALAGLPFLAALLAGAAPAAAAPWSTPAAIPGAPASIPVLAQSAAGPAAVYWETLRFPPAATATGTLPGIDVGVSTLGDGLVPGPAQALAGPVQPGYAVAYGRGNAAISGGGAASVATGPLAGPFRIHTFPAPIQAVAANAAGSVAVLIEPCHTQGPNCPPAAPSLSIARAGHGFGRPIALDHAARGLHAALAIDPRGRVLAAWDSRGKAYARFVSSSGRLGPIRRLGSDPHPSTFDVALPGDGRAAVGWTSQSVEEGDPGTVPFTARIAVAGSSGRFGAAHLLGTVRPSGIGSYIPYNGIAVRLPARHAGFVTWSDHDATSYVVRAESIDGTRLGAAQTVSQAGADTVLTDAASGPLGAGVILLLPGRSGEFGSSNGHAAGLAAVTRPAGASAFGAPEQIVPAPADIDGARVSIDALSGAVFATWSIIGDPIDWSVRTPIG